MKRPKNIAVMTACFLLLLFPFSIFAKNSFVVAPTRAEIDLKRSVTKSFFVRNSGEDPIRISVEMEYYKIGSNTLQNAKPLDPKNVPKDDLTPYMLVSPRAFSLMPNQRRFVRVSVRPPQDLPKGEYRGYLLFRMVEIAESQTAKDIDKTKIGMSMTFKLATSVPVYGRNGEGTANLEAQCLLYKKDDKDKDEKLKIIVKNTAPWRFDGWIEVYTEKAEDSAKMLTKQKLFIFRESEQEYTLDWSPPKGTSKLQLRWRPLESDSIIGKFTCSLGSQESAKKEGSGKEKTTEKSE